jgi:FtsP/CotA-like multicopper oxidase with cupredoxin domain
MGLPQRRSTETHDDHAADATKHMAGLVLGIAVAPHEGVSYDRGPAHRTLDLYFNQGRARGRAETSYSYVLQQGAKAPRADSIIGVGSTIVVTRGEPTDIVVHNQAREGTSIHWHGIELESWSDGVAGWSGQGTAVAPVVEPGQRFGARLSLPRAGTFMYHTHLNDVPQVTGGAVGALLVLEPGTRYDPARDHVYIGHWNGATAPPGAPMNLLVNGDSIGAPERAFAAGVTHRFRFINIGPANNIRFEIRRDTTMASWRGRAKDGADLPAALQVEQSAHQSLAVGETFDFDFTPPAPGQYVLTAAFGVRPAMWTQRLTFK